MLPVCLKLLSSLRLSLPGCLRSFGCGIALLSLPPLDRMCICRYSARSPDTPSPPSGGRGVKLHGHARAGLDTYTTFQRAEIHPVTRFTRRAEQASFQPFVNYRTGKRHPGGSQLYWKTLSTIVREYLNHPEAKFRNGGQTGRMKRKHLLVQKGQIHYIGKEAHEIEETEILGVSEDLYVEYR